MPTTKSAKKRMKTSEEARQLNSAAKRLMATRRRQLVDAIRAGDRDGAEKAYRGYSSAVDKAAKKGVINRTSASRRKARGAARMARA